MCKKVNPNSVKTLNQSVFKGNQNASKAKVKSYQKEEEFKSIWLERKSFRLALLSMFTALSVVLGYMLAGIPNVELFTLSIFLGGFVMGKREGFIIGMLSSLIYVFFNPYGASPIPLFIYQIFHYCFVGLCGGLMSSWLDKKEYFQPDSDLYIFKLLVYFGFLGFALTFLFDVLTGLIDTIMIYGVLDAFIPYFMTGVFFTTIHEIGNMLGFIFILPGLIQISYKLLH